jgi:hypothetical protein
VTRFPFFGPKACGRRQPSNMPLQRTRSRALLGRSPLNGGSLGVGKQPYV